MRIVRGIAAGLDSSVLGRDRNRVVVAIDCDLERVAVVEQEGEGDRFGDVLQLRSAEIERFDVLDDMDLSPNLRQTLIDEQDVVDIPAI